MRKREMKEGDALTLYARKQRHSSDGDSYAPSNKWKVCMNRHPASVNRQQRLRCLWLVHRVSIGLPHEWDVSCRSPNLPTGSANIGAGIHWLGEYVGVLRRVKPSEHPDVLTSQGHCVTKVTLPKAAARGQCLCHLQTAHEGELTNSKVARKPH
jgi:hypothetical protein